MKLLFRRCSFHLQDVYGFIPIFVLQGISPKLEFATKTVIKESISPEVDALEDAFEQEKVLTIVSFARSFIISYGNFCSLMVNVLK